MAKVRNVSASSLEVRLPDFTGLADPDEVLEVPDDVFAAYAWPESLWAVVVPVKSVKKGEA